MIRRIPCEGDFWLTQLGEHFLTQSSESVAHDRRSLPEPEPQRLSGKRFGRG